LEKYDGGLVRFGDNAVGKICGKRSISFDGKHNTDNVLYVKGLKHNLLSVGQMCDKGYDLRFKDNECKIMEISETVIATSKKTRCNFYQLRGTNDYYLLAQEDESWLWHRRLCQINFDNLVKISLGHTIRDLPKLVKPTNTICKECKLGK